jgi:hypothetical protein
MAVTSAQIVDFLLANPGMTDAQIVAAMEQYGVSPAQMASAVGLDVGEVVSRVAVTVPQGQTITLGDTIIAPEYRVIGSGEDQQIGNLETIYTSKTTGDPNYRAPVGSEYQQYNADGTFQRTGTTQAVAGSFLEGLGEALTDPVVLAALAGGYGAGLFGGAGALGGAATVGSTGLTMAELAQLDLALGGAGGTAGATALANSLTTGALTGTLTNLTGGSGTGTLGVGSSLGTGLTAAGAGGLGGTAGATGLGGSLGTGLTTAGVGGLGGTGTVAGLGTGIGTGLVTGAGTGLGTGLGTTLAGVGTGVLTGVGTGVGTGLGTTLAGVGTGVGTNLATRVGTGLTAGNLANLFSGGLGTAGSLLQMQQSKEAAQQAQLRIDAETAAAKQAAAFRPIGMTTRFGTSQFQVDPVTGQLTSAGYTLDPQAKNAQDRFVALAEQGLQQAEGAQAQFAPLQTGAQSLFDLGNQYISQSPQSVAENYLKQQMALLQPGRETELANLQNKLQQQGRGGLSVSQGGSFGATTPELQALYNARAQQEAVLAANAQQAGQQQVLYGAGLLGQGSQAMGQYYGGQQAAYSPYTTALGQVQNLETLGQQPFNMSTALGQQSATAGSRVGQLGIEGARLSAGLATNANATTNPYAQALMAAGNPNAMFGQALGNVFGGLFS